MRSAVRITLPIAVAISCLMSGAACPAAMVRVIRVVDGATLVVDDAGSQRTLRLAGVEIPPGYSPHSTSYQQLASDALTRAVSGRWVLVEEDAAGGAYLYRSPDAWFVNREMIRGGFELLARTPCSRSAELLDAERFARAQGSGYWSPSGAGEALSTSGHMTYLGISDPAPSKRPSANAAVPRTGAAKASRSPRSPSRARRQPRIIDFSRP